MTDSEVLPKLDEVSQRANEITHYICDCQLDGSTSITFCGNLREGPVVEDPGPVGCPMCAELFELGWTCKVCGTIW